ncbi:hypothetical protein SDC9_105288 [bioreactor metagenome]|uniref:Uncharacterized protein n=1 Tax=bioreactor metagenome TaxID=1076179 RepID=A0A645AZ63_9ZZZZ
MFPCLVIQIGKGGHAGSFTPRCVKAHSVARTVRNIYCRIKPVGFKCVGQGGVVVVKSADRERQFIENEIVLGKKADVRAVIPFVVIAGFLTHQPSQITTQNAFVAEFASEARDSQARCVLHVQVQAVNIAAVIIGGCVPRWDIGCSGPEQMIYIVMPAPVQ